MLYKMKPVENFRIELLLTGIKWVKIEKPKWSTLYKQVVEGEIRVLIHIRGMACLDFFYPWARNRAWIGKN